MEFTPRRVLLFLIVSTLVLISWKNFVINPMRDAERRIADAKQNQAEENPADPAAETNPNPDGNAAEPKPGQENPDQPEDDPKPAAPKPGEVKPKNHPRQEVTLGSLEKDSGYFFQATLTTQGAAVSRIELNDPRYRNLEDPTQPLGLIEPVDGVDEDGDDKTFRTFTVTSPEIDKLLEPYAVQLDSVDWAIIKPENPDPNQVVFEYILPNAYRLTKTFTIAAPGETPPTTEDRDNNTAGYFLTMNLAIENLQDAKAEVSYQLQGPVGMPLEDPESTRKFRDIQIGTRDGDAIKHKALTTAELAKTINKGNKLEEWAAPFQYVGVDGQFFATLVYNPSEDPTTKMVEQYVPQPILLDKDDPNRSKFSVLFTSKTLELPPGGTSDPHEYTLYAGPKRQSLLSNMRAGDVLEFGWFAAISKGMLWILSLLHDNLYLPYGFAIIGLTIMVRGALFPLSKKQAQSAARMKELQPKLQELKKKYGDDKQKFAQAQMDLFRDAGYNPFAGCLPMLFQMPIFFGLYSALNHAVDLRAAEFLWVNNLAAPDHLFQWPGGFSLPFGIGRYFNLLPIVTIALFLVQQKMFMPAPDPDDEQAQMTHKMMNIMMIVMGFFFYNVPAGLCVYFIASSLWGMGERKLLDFGKSKTPATAEGGEGNATNKAAPSGGLFGNGKYNSKEKGRNTASKKGNKKSKTRR